MEEQDLARGVRVPQDQGLQQDPGHREPPWGWGEVGGWTGTLSHGWVSGSGDGGQRWPQDGRPGPPRSPVWGSHVGTAGDTLCVLTRILQNAISSLLIQFTTYR